MSFLSWDRGLVPRDATALPPNTNGEESIRKCGGFSRALRPGLERVQVCNGRERGPNSSHPRMCIVSWAIVAYRANGLDVDGAGGVGCRVIWPWPNFSPG